MSEITALTRRIERVEAELARQKDLWAINELLQRYSHALDWQDGALLDTVFYDDASIDYGFFKGTGKDFKPLLMDIEKSFGRRWHFTSQVQIDLHGDKALINSYNLSTTLSDPSSIPPCDLSQFYGYYIDEAVRRNGKWGLMSRRYLLVAGQTAREIEQSGTLEALNKIGHASPAHGDFRRLSHAPPLDPA